MVDMPMRDWNLYHKVIMTVLVALAFTLVLRLVLSIWGGAITVRADIEIDASPEEVWSLVTENDERARWEAHVIDVVRLSGEAGAPGSTRFVFWKTPEGKRWNALEETAVFEPDSRIVFRRESDDFNRLLDVQVEALEPCKSRVTVREVVRPTAYGRRAFAFLYKGAYEERLDVSVNALKTWAARRTACGAD